MFNSRFGLFLASALLLLCVVKPVGAQSAPVRATTVTGLIELDDPKVTFTNVTVIVTIRDVSFLDIPSPPVAVLKMQHVNSGKKVPFTVKVPNPNPQRTYAAEVLVDVNGDGKISVGDYLNVYRENVIEQGQVKKPSVEVRRVN